MLAAVNEGLGHSLRIPLNREQNVALEKLSVPNGWMMPCFIGIGYLKADEQLLAQYEIDVEKSIHKGGW